MTEPLRILNLVEAAAMLRVHKTTLAGRAQSLALEALHRGADAQPAGVTRAGNKWRARVGVSAARKTVGYFTTKSAAHVAQTIALLTMSP